MIVPRVLAAVMFSSLFLTRSNSTLMDSLKFEGNWLCRELKLASKSFSSSLFSLAFRFVKMIVVALISILIISQRSPLSSSSRYLVTNSGIPPEQWKCQNNKFWSWVLQAATTKQNLTMIESNNKGRYLEADNTEPKHNTRILSEQETYELIQNRYTSDTLRVERKAIRRLLVIMILLNGKLLKTNTKPKTRKRITNGKSNENKSADKIRDNVTIKDIPNRFFGSLTGGYEAQCWPLKYSRV